MDTPPRRLGAAATAMRQRGQASVHARTLALRNLAYDGLARIPRLRPASAPAGPMATVLVAIYLPPEVNSRSTHAAPATLDQTASDGHSCGRSSGALRVRSWSFATPASQPFPG